jgi:hypothetical protein
LKSVENAPEQSSGPRFPPEFCVGRRFSGGATQIWTPWNGVNADS